MEAEGADHTVSLTSDGTLLRRRKSGADGLAVTAEAALLELVARHTSIPVPTVVRVWPDDDAMELELLPGVPLSELLDGGPPREPAVEADWARRLVGFQDELAALPLGLVEGLIPADDLVTDALLAEAADFADAASGVLPREASSGVRRFLETAPPPGPQRSVPCHADLGAEHVFVDAGTGEITGVIDWSDAAVTDPALDLGLVLRDLGPDAFAAATDGRPLGDDPHLVDRGWFHARCRTLEDLAYGLEGRDAYVRNALRSARRLFVERP